MTMIAPAPHPPVEIEERKRLTSAQKSLVMERQDGQCAKCKRPFHGLVEFDHVLPIALGGSSDLSNYEALCAVPCHAIKTVEDVKRIRKAHRLERDHNPETRRQTKHKIRNRGFAKADSWKGAS